MLVLNTFQTIPMFYNWLTSSFQTHITKTDRVIVCSPVPNKNMPDVSSFLADNFAAPTLIVEFCANPQRFPNPGKIPPYMPWRQKCNLLPAFQSFVPPVVTRTVCNSNFQHLPQRISASFCFGNAIPLGKQCLSFDAKAGWLNMRRTIRQKQGTPNMKCSSGLSN